MSQNESQNSENSISKDKVVFVKTKEQENEIFDEMDRKRIKRFNERVELANGMAEGIDEELYGEESFGYTRLQFIELKRKAYRSIGILEKVKSDPKYRINLIQNKNKQLEETLKSRIEKSIRNAIKRIKAAINVIDSHLEMESVDMPMKLNKRSPGRKAIKTNESLKLKDVINDIYYTDLEKEIVKLKESGDLSCPFDEARFIKCLRDKNWFYKRYKTMTYSQMRILVKNEFGHDMKQNSFNRAIQTPGKRLNLKLHPVIDI